MGIDSRDIHDHEQLAIRSILERIASINSEDWEFFGEVVDLVRSRSRKLDAADFKERKETLRGKGQIIPPEFDLAFLDQTTLQIYLNTGTVPDDAVDEITEHEATEMVRVLMATRADEKPDNETWRRAHHAALIAEYNKAKANGRLEKHHAWMLNYLESLKQKFPGNDLLTQVIERQAKERTEVYAEIHSTDKLG